MISFDQSPLLAGIRNVGLQPPPDVQDQLLDQLMAAIGNFYVHLPLKRSAFAIDPVGQLAALRNSPEHRSDFLRQIIRIVAGLRDRHTTLTLPPPWNTFIAYVPFVVERCVINAREAFVVTKQLFGFTELPIGAIVTHWNGMPIQRKVARLAAESQGGNPDAARHLALTNLTISPLAYMLMPDEDWVTLTYLDRNQAIQTVSTPWRLYVQNNATATASQPATGAAPLHVGLDAPTLKVNLFKKDSISSKPVKRRTRRDDLDTGDFGLRYGSLSTPSGTVGYLRIYSFAVPDAVAFVTACARILDGLPQDRLVIDVRGNPGGTITAGQKLIRLLTGKKSLVTSALAFRNTTSSRALATLPLFAPWRTSLDLQQRTGEQFSQAIPLTTYDDVPDYRYPGKIALITDGLGYSTTDFFAADFQDNGVGIIVGNDAQTGGGGANVWSWNLLQLQAQAAGLPLAALPGGFDLNLAVRRSVRSGASAGIPVEDLGVTADVRYDMTLADVLGNNRGVIEFAAAQLR